MGESCFYVVKLRSQSVDLYFEPLDSPFKFRRLRHGAWAYRRLASFD